MRPLKATYNLREAEPVTIIEILASSGFHPTVVFIDGKGSLDYSYVENFQDCHYADEPGVAYYENLMERLGTTG